MFAWLNAISPQLAGFLGYLSGILGALLTIYMVNFVNAYFERKRSELRRMQEMRALADALSTELRLVQQTLRTLGEKWRNRKEATLLRTDLSGLTQVYPQLGSQLALLPKEAMEAAIKAYALISDYDGLLSLHDATPADAPCSKYGITVSPDRARLAAKVNDSIARRIQQAIDALAMPEMSGKKHNRSKWRARPLSKEALSLQALRVSRNDRAKPTDRGARPQNPIAA